tara:strand:- start:131 stop:352 length:222 start_codon:yes stop_codon:yes gene_type:complete
VLIEAPAYSCGWVASNNSVGFDITTDDRAVRNDRAMANVYARKNGAIRANPDIAADHHIASGAAVFAYIASFR